MTENRLFVLGGLETHLHDIFGAVHDGKNRGRSEGWVERKLREKSEMMVALSVQLTAGKEGVL